MMNGLNTNGKPRERRDNMHILSKGKSVTTHSIPASIAPKSSGRNETLLMMKRLMNEPFKDNPGAASMCVTLAIIEAIENSGQITEPEQEAPKDHPFNWGQGGSITTHDSISFVVNKLFFEDYKEEDEAKFKQFIQNKLLPRGLEILEESSFEELCDMIIKALEC